MSDGSSSNEPIEAAIVELRQRITQMQGLLAGLEALRAGQPITNQELSSPGIAPTPTQIMPGMFHGMSIVEAVKQLLAVRKKPMGTVEITAEIIAGGMVFSGATPGNTVGSVLHREASKSGAGIINVGRGTWALPAWYSNPGRFQKKKAGEKGDGESDAAAPAPAVAATWKGPKAVT